MLSIAPLGGGSARYYSGSARQDYRAAGGEPPGLWIGAGAEALGLRGEVHPLSLEWLFKGQLNHDQPLVKNVGASNRQVGWGLLFSMPKELSIYSQIVSDEVRRKIEASHLDAVKATMSYVERHLLHTRRESQGQMRELAKMVAAIYLHHLSRNLDPHVHAHVLLFNVGLRNDATTGSILSKLLYDNKKLLNAIYEAELAQNITHRVGLVLERVGTSFGVKGIGRRVVEHFSSRQKEVVARLAELGLSSAAASHIAALETRQPKEMMLRLDDLRTAWKREARAIRFLPGLVGLGLPRWRSSAPRIVDAAARELGRELGQFTLSKLRIRALQISIRYSVPVKEVFNAVQRYDLISREIVTVGKVRNEPVLTTKRNRDVQKAVIRAALEMTRADSHSVARALVHKVIDSYRTHLTQAQEETVRRLTVAKGRMRLLLTAPRADASFVLDVARYIWELDGYRVVGATQSRKSAETLQASTGINAVTVKDLSRRLEISFARKVSIRIRNVVRSALHQKLIPAPAPQLTPNTILVLHGARDIDVERWLPIIERAHKANALVVAVDEDTRSQSDLPFTVFKGLSIAIGGPVLPAERTGPILGRSESRNGISQSQDVSRSENDQQRQQDASLQTAVAQNKAVAQEEMHLQKDDMASTLQRLLSQIQPQQRS